MWHHNFGLDRILLLKGLLCDFALLPAQNKGMDAPRPDGRYALVLEGAHLIVCVIRIERAADQEEEESEHGLMQHDGEKTARAQSDA